MNGLYDALAIVLIFPLIIFLGASGEIQSATGKKICKFLGDISYPIYITHYPLIYTYTAWVAGKKIPLKDAYPIAILTFVGAVSIAYACLKWYDEPVRKWLNSKVFAKAEVKVPKA
jgi:peptidoglycan/LPS O-acetylase OafA/YrhL